MVIDNFVVVVLIGVIFLLAMFVQKLAWQRDDALSKYSMLKKEHDYMERKFRAYIIETEELANILGEPAPANADWHKRLLDLMEQDRNEFRY